MVVHRSGVVFPILCALFNYPKCCQPMSRISFYMKSLGQRSAGNPHAALDVAGAGNVLHCSGAPVLDPTGEEKQGNSPTTPCFLLYSPPGGAWSTLHLSSMFMRAVLSAGESGIRSRPTWCWMHWNRRCMPEPVRILQISATVTDGYYARHAYLSSDYTIAIWLLFTNASTPVYSRDRLKLSPTIRSRNPGCVWAFYGEAI